MSSFNVPKCGQCSSNYIDSIEGLCHVCRALSITGGRKRPITLDDSPRPRKITKREKEAQNEINNYIRMESMKNEIFLLRVSLNTEKLESNCKIIELTDRIRSLESTVARLLYAVSAQIKEMYDNSASITHAPDNQAEEAITTEESSPDCLSTPEDWDIFGNNLLPDGVFEPLGIVEQYLDPFVDSPPLMESSEQVSFETPEEPAQSDTDLVMSALVKSECDGALSSRASRAHRRNILKGKF